MAERVGDSASIGALRQSLAEEETMAKFIQEQIVPTTARFMELTAVGEKAKV
jgi:ferritin-like metal-binding protein YciE